MKKIALLLLSLALVVGCIFALSSCGECEHEFDESALIVTKKSTCYKEGEGQNICTKCNKSVEVTVKMIDHSWSDQMTVDVEPTCSTLGSKSYHCTRFGCSAKKDSTDISYDNTKHTVSSWTTTKEPTMFLNGIHQGICTACSQSVESDVSNEGCYTVVSSLYPSSWSETKTYSQVLGTDEHFYPTDENPTGKDLFIEFSVFWNEYAENKGQDILWVGLWRTNGGGNFPLLNLNLKDGISGQWGQEAGTMDAMGTLDGGYTTASPFKGKSGSTLYNTQNPSKSLPGLTDYGWYRIGVQVHQDAVIEGGVVVYYGVCSIYLNGEFVLQWNIRMQDNERGLGLANEDKGGLLYTARINQDDTTKLDYFDNTDGFGPYIRMEGMSSNPDFYLPIGDISFSAGSDFAKKVEKLATPTTANATLAENKAVVGKQFYDVKAPD